MGLFYCQPQSQKIILGTIPIYSIVADSAEATGLKWATPAAGGAYTLLSTTTISGDTNITSISQAYKFLYVTVFGVYGNTASPEFKLRFNNDSSSIYNVRKIRTDGTQIANSENGMVLSRFSNSSDTINGVTGSFWLPNYTSSDNKWIESNMASSAQGDWLIGTYGSTTAISQLNFYASSGSLSGGTIRIYGVN